MLRLPECHVSRDGSGKSHPSGAARGLFIGCKTRFAIYSKEVFYVNNGLNLARLDIS